ncbi:MAG: SMP-30/gluconolactonase/LRE family protein [Novosphingobium sp.]|nr:SMP-30/gluconolactonase/LRE family protein [Novosphingobium sp.]
MAELAVGDFERIASGIYLEGLCYDFARDVIWYSDVIAGGIHGVRPDGTRVGSFNEDRMWTGGVMMNADGRVLSTGAHGIMWNDPETGKSGWLLDELEGQPINGINEMWPDGTGGIFFGTNDIEKIILGEDTRPTAIYRLTVDRRTIRLADGQRFTNGLAYDPLRRRFYCNNTFDSPYVWDVAEDLTLFNPRRLMEKEDCDGMSLDSAGNVWITGFRSQFIERVAPDGSMLERVATPQGSVTQLRFGGADLCDYYITVVPADGGDTLKEGGELTGANAHLYRGRSEIAGIGVAAARFTLD